MLLCGSTSRYLLKDILFCFTFHNTKKLNGEHNKRFRGYVPITLQIRTKYTYIYRPQRSWGKVIFSQASVILSTGGGVPGQVPPWDQVHPPGTRYTPQDQVHPPGPGTPPLGPGTLPGPGTPPRTRYTLLGPGTPPGTRYIPQDQVHPPGPGTPPWTRYTPQEQCMPGDMGNKRAVRILLECSLVLLGNVSVCSTP